MKYDLAFWIHNERWLPIKTEIIPYEKARSGKEFSRVVTVIKGVESDGGGGRRARFVVHACYYSRVVVFDLFRPHTSCVKKKEHYARHVLSDYNMFRRKVITIITCDVYNRISFRDQRGSNVFVCRENFLDPRLVAGPISTLTRKLGLVRVVTIGYHRLPWRHNNTIIFGTCYSEFI